MFTGKQGLSSQIEVRIGWGGDDDSAHFSIVQHALVVGGYFYPAKLSGDIVEPLVIAVTDGREGPQMMKVANQVLSPVSTTD
ncbi:MAG: hypothetical protein BWY75_01461 [bacterium ADurb.Bin425]|nr:MAG: hypothetical protein BWY75_01461 [bacterium ADurb.Bin425]